MKRNCVVLALLATTLVAVLGCSGEAKLEGLVQVTGIVNQKGSPLAGATVTFSPVGKGEGKAASGKTDSNGRFKVTTLKADDGAIPGDYQVTVEKKETVGKTYTQEEANDYYMKHQKQPPAPEVKQLVAEKFTKAATSGLKATVKKGDKNDFTFDVE